MSRRLVKKKKIKKKEGETIKEYKYIEKYKEVERESLLKQFSLRAVSFHVNVTQRAGKVCGIIARLLSRKNRGGRIYSRDIYVLRVIYNCILFSFSL